MNRIAVARWRRWTSPVCAFVLALAVQLLVLHHRHDHPFGDRSRNVSDFGSQYLAFHAQFRRMLSGGHSLTNLWFTWTGGGGVPFLPDYAYYLGGPLTLLVRLFPLTRVETAILVISTLRVCLAAATMSLLLQRINRRAPVLLVVLLACGYACSSWVFDTAIYTPMWLDAEWCLPLAFLAMHWCLERRRALPAILVVAVMVWCNFYTAFMVSFGCLVYLLGLLAQDAVRPREALGALVRAGRTMLLGWGLMAWMLVPTLTALRTAVPVPPAGVPEVMQGIAYSSYWPRLLSETEGYGGSPAISVGSLALVLALSLPFAMRTRPRVRWTWSLVVALLLVLSNTPALLWVWNVFDVPQGNHFRFSFVLCAFLVIAAVHAWPARATMPRDVGHSRPRGPGGGAASENGDGATAVRFSRWPGLLQLGGAGVLVGALCWSAHPRFSTVLSVAHGSRRDVLVVWGVLCLGAVVIRALAARVHGLMVETGLTLVGVLWVVETVQGAGFTQDVLRHRLGTMPITSGSRLIYRTSGAAAMQRAGWPLHRTATIGAPDLPVFSYYNQGALLGTASVGYYSSNMPVVVSAAYAGLGAFTDLEGRMMREVDSQIASDPLLATVTSIQDPRHVAGPTLPMVRVLPAAPRSRAGNAFENRNILLGSDVYAPARVASSAGGPVTLPLRLGAGSSTGLTIGCAASTVPTVQFAKLQGTVTAGATGAGSAAATWHRDVNTANIIQLPEGTTAVHLLATHGTTLLAASCLDAARVRPAVAAAVAPTHLELPPGRIVAHFATPVTGTVTASTVDQSGWRCQGDGRALPITSNAGFLAVQVHSTSNVRCSYREPGVTSGSAASLCVLLLVGATGWWGRRRREDAARPREASGVMHDASQRTDAPSSLDA